MTCLSESTLLAILERRLPPEDMAKVDEHVDHCDACRNLVACLAHDVSTPGRPETPATPANEVSPTTAVKSANKLSVGTLLADRYLVLEMVGAGGMGIVYAAYDRQLDRKVAVKLVRAEIGSPERLVQEARSLARLTHPNVVVVHDVGEALGQAYMAMEFVQGSTLRKWQKDTQPKADRILEVYLEAAKGLAAAHAAGVVHRDIKPENILLGDDGRVRIMDFGLARAESSVKPSLSDTTTLEGTWLYMSPERFDGKPSDARSDQFAFCVALYEALYGEHPFEFTKLIDVPNAMHQGRLRRVPRGRAVDKGVRAVLLRGLSSDPAARFGSMDEFAGALRAVGRKKRLRTLTIAALGTVALFGTSIAAFASTAAPPPCTGSDRLMADVWNAETRAAIERAFADTKLIYAPDASRTVKETLDRYAQRWITTHTQACQATRVHREQSEEVLDLRMACLGTRLSSLRALTDRLAHADGRAVEKAPEATQQLGAPEICDEAHVVAEKLPPPDAAVDAQVKTLREKLTHLEANWQLGHEAEALEEAKKVAKEAESVPYPALQAEAGFWFGRLFGSAPDAKSREGILLRALHAAEAGSQERMAMDTWIEIAKVRLYWATNQFDAASEALDHADAYATRLGDEEAKVRVLVVRTAILRSEKNYAKGLGTAKEAVERCEAMPRCAKSSLHRANIQLAIMLGLTGDVEGSLKTFDRAAALTEQLLGAGHPLMASVLNDRSHMLSEVKRYEEAATVLRRAIAIAERANVGDGFMNFLLVNLCSILEKQGTSEERLDAAQRTIATTGRLMGAESPQLIDLLIFEGDALVALKRGNEAVDVYERALRIQAKQTAPNPPKVTVEEIGKKLEACGTSCAEALKKLDGWGKEHP